MTYKIQANASGTRSIEVMDAHLATLRKYHLLHHLVDSNGIVDESVVNKLKLNVRSLLESEHGVRTRPSSTSASTWSIIRT